MRTCLWGRTSPWVVAAAASLAAACGGGGEDGVSAAPPAAPTQERLALVQQDLPVADFAEAVQADPDLQATVTWLQATTGVSDFSRALVLQDEDGVELMLAEMTGAQDQRAVVLRHCRADDCVSVRQELAPGPDGLLWTTPTGAIPYRTALAPLLLRVLDPDDPVRTAVLGTPDTSPVGQVSGGAEVGPTTPGPPTDPTRKLRLASIFGKWMTFQGPSFAALETSMKAAGFPAVEPTYHVNSTEVDNALATLQPKDAFVWIAHGEQNAKTGKMAGMSVAWYAWGGDHYPVTRIKSQLASNPSGGPGILFLAGCLTDGLLADLDDGKRIVLGFTGKIEPGLAFRTVKAFFDTLAAGDTVEKAIAAGNAEIKKGGKTYELRSVGGPLTQTYVQVGTFPVTYVNQDKMPMHFLVGPAFEFPGTRVEDGQSVDGSLQAIPDKVYFLRAGREGKFLSGEVACHYQADAVITGTRRVVWTGSSLSCPNW